MMPRILGSEQTGTGHRGEGQVTQSEFRGRARISHGSVRNAVPPCPPFKTTTRTPSVDPDDRYGGCHFRGTDDNHWRSHRCQ